MRLNPMTALLLLFCGMLLSACARERVKYVTATEILRPDVPDYLLTCDPEPELPEGEYTQRTVAGYIVRLHNAGQSCRGNLAAVKGLLEDFERENP